MGRARSARPLGLFIYPGPRWAADQAAKLPLRDSAGVLSRSGLFIYGFSGSVAV